MYACKQLSKVELKETAYPISERKETLPQALLVLPLVDLSPAGHLRREKHKLF